MAPPDVIVGITSLDAFRSRFAPTDYSPDSRPDTQDSEPSFDMDIYAPVHKIEASPVALSDVCTLRPPNIPVVRSLQQLHPSVIR